jgi:hypothetical protein
MTLDPIAQFTDAALKEAVKFGVQAGVSGGKSLWGWLRGKVSGTDAAVLEQVAAAPEKASAPDKLRGVLRDLLDDKPELAEELAALLKELAPAAPTQAATVTGDHNSVVQIAGNGAKVTVQR